MVVFLFVIVGLHKYFALRFIHCVTFTTVGKTLLLVLCGSTYEEDAIRLPDNTTLAASTVTFSRQCGQQPSTSARLVLRYRHA